MIDDKIIDFQKQNWSKMPNKTVTEDHPGNKTVTEARRKPKRGERGKARLPGNLPVVYLVTQDTNWGTGSDDVGLIQSTKALIRAFWPASGEDSTWPEKQQWSFDFNVV